MNDDGPAAPSAAAFPPQKAKSSFGIKGKVTADHPALKNEDAEIQKIVMEEVERTDANQDGQIDRDEFVEAIKETAKRSRASADREQRLERKLKKSHRKIMSLSVLSILLVVVSAVAIYFAVDNGNAQVKETVVETVLASAETVIDSQETHVSSDVTGTPHLVDRHGADVSVQANGVVATGVSHELEDGSKVACVPIGEVTRVVHGLMSSAEASLVVTDDEGNVSEILPLSGAFRDGGSEMSFGDGRVRVQLDSTECDAIMDGDGEGGTSGDDASGGPSDRRHLRSAAGTSGAEHAASRADVLREKREQYASSLEAVRRVGRRQLWGLSSGPYVTIKW